MTGTYFMSTIITLFSNMVWDTFPKFDEKNTVDLISCSVGTLDERLGKGGFVCEELMLMDLERRF